MFDLLDKSPLEWPIRLLKLIPPVGKYYGAVNNAPSAYEHLYVGFIAQTIGASTSWWFALSVWILHFVVKELLVDGWKKHWIRKLRGLEVSQDEMNGFLVDCIMRNAGFVLGLPFYLAR